MRISDWSSDVCSSDLTDRSEHQPGAGALHLHVAERLPVDPADGDLGRERRGELRDPDGVRRGGRGQLVDLHRSTDPVVPRRLVRSEEHTSELQSLMRISYAVFCLKTKKDKVQI